MRFDDLGVVVHGRSYKEAATTDVAPDPQRHRVMIDLPRQTVRTWAGSASSFGIDGEARVMLVAGLDAIDLTLTHRDAIAVFYAADAGRRPWAYPRRSPETA